MSLTDEPRVVEALRARLDEVGFAEDGLRRLLSAGEFTTLGPDDEPVHARRLSDDPLSTFAALFAVGIGVEEARVARDFGPISIDGLVRIGLVARGGGMVTTGLRILPFDGFLVAGERGDPARSRQDIVPPPHRASMTSLQLTVRAPVARALDLGTGCGCIAIALTRGASNVVATDINPRALTLLAFNARLNGVNVEARLGSWDEPIDGERFDLVNINPPFVVSPDTRLTFRDAGMERDEVSRFAVGIAARVLNEGGFATVLVNWVHRGESGDWWEPVKPWLEDLGCDAWVLRSQTVDPLTYAAQWNQDRRTIDPDGFAATLDRWLAYDEQEGITALSVGAIVLRRREGANWARAVDLGPGPLGPASAHLQRMFAGVDRSRTTSDADLLSGRLRLAPGVELVSTFRMGDARVSAAPMKLKGPVGIDTTTDPRLLPVLLDLDGTRPVSVVLDAHGIDETSAISSLRMLLEEGWIVAA